MAFSIQNFASNVMKSGGARPNLFEVRITDQGFGEDFSFYCKAAQLPASVIGQVDVPYFGRQVRLAGDRTFENWTITVLQQETMNHHQLFEAWMHKINNYADNLDTTGGVAGYKVDAEVIHYMKDGSENRRYKFKGMFPINLGAIELAWDNNDAVEEFTVEMTYDYYESSGAGGAALS